MSEELITGLDELSRSFADALFAVYPAWLSNAVVQREPGEEDGYLELEVRSLGGGERLLVYTEGGEVTVDFAGYHSHFDWPPRGDEPLGHWNEPLTFIAAILADKLLAATAWNGTDWRGSWPMSPGENVPTNDYVLSGAKTIRVRSWSGQQDADLALG